MGAKRHFNEKLSPSFVFRPCQKPTLPFDHSMDADYVGMKKIVENYIIVKPKVERIGGRDDFEELIKGKMKL